MSPTLEESAALMGGFRWVETRLFELLGAWVPSAGEPEVMAMLDRHSQHAAWRAAQWWDRLPVVASIDRPSLVRAPSAGYEAAVEVLGQDGLALVERLAGAYRVLFAHLAVGYRGLRAAATPWSDGPVMRTLGHVVPDLIEDWLEGEAALQSMLTVATDSGAGAELAYGVAARLESLLVDDPR